MRIAEGQGGNHVLCVSHKTQLVYRESEDELEPRSAVASCASPCVCLCVCGVDLEQSVVLGHGVASLAQHLVHRPRPAPHRAKIQKRETIFRTRGSHANTDS